MHLAKVQTGVQAGMESYHERIGLRGECKRRQLEAEAPVCPQGQGQGERELVQPGRQERMAPYHARLC